MEAGNEFPVGTQHIEHLCSNTGHDVHVADNVGGVSDLNTVLGNVGANGTHGEGDDVHGASLHAAGVEASHGGLQLLGVNPVVGGSGILFLDAGNIGTAFNTGNV